MSLALSFTASISEVSTTESGAGVPSATDADSSSASCKLALAALALAILSSLSFLVRLLRGDALGRFAILLGDEARAARLLVPLLAVLGGDKVTSLCALGISNLGGAEMFLRALFGLGAMSRGSSNARIHNARPYSDANSRAVQLSVYDGIRVY